jgi:hypothetical protein
MLKIRPSRSHGARGSEWPPMSVAARDVLVRSAAEADMLECVGVGREHVLLALLRAPEESEAGVIVDRLGLKRAPLISTVFEFIALKENKRSAGEPDTRRLALPESCPACGEPLFSEEIASRGREDVVRRRMSCPICGYRLPYGRAGFVIEPARRERKGEGYDLGA